MSKGSKLKAALQKCLGLMLQGDLTRKAISRLTSIDSSGKVLPGWTTVRLLQISTCLMSGCILSALVLPGLPLGWCFGEGDLMTWISFLSLIAVSRLSYLVWKIRAAEETSGDAFIWRFFSIGFAYLAFDELLRFHESIDHLIHRLVGVRPTNITDHFDDAIVGLYGFIGLVALVISRRELFKFWKTWPFLAGAAAFTFLTVVFDFLASAKWLLKSFIVVPADLQLTIDVLDVIEEWFKVYGEMFFVGAFVSVLTTAQSLALPREIKSAERREITAVTR